VLAKLSADIGAVVDSPQFAERTRPLGIDVRSSTPAGLDSWFAAEINKWAEIAREAGIKPDQ
jgi:tripartite-type tricarboxylate transporter receptor subunit TctC